ncbi:hypothetical protein RD792_010074 [Penstemon davidsonii]|uniref:Xylanase inhibitor C-terminal domain-containing protein n=1 Tax=Penstemon davidsonii TaxID=160366 RepID=A0ABR0D1Z3_9LAMI|nr:hypothetical protein RD792_010074 [Penstemon davidsonii]
MKLNLPNKFTLCLPSSGIGKLLIGGGKSVNPLKTTPLIINPVSTGVIFSQGQPSDEYFIDVKSISVDGKSVSVKDTYFTIDKNGAAADMRIKSVGSVVPFRACFRSGSIRRGLLGPVVPTIDLVLGGNDVYWRIEGGNSMVEIDRDIMCLGFVDGGSRPRTSVVIGVHQLEENFLEFDLVSSQLKFFSSLLVQNKSCSRI